MHELCTSCPPNLSSCEAAALVSPTPKLVIVRDNGTRAVTIKTCHRSRQRHPCRHHQMRRIKNKKGKKRHLKRPQNQENTIDNRNPVVKSQSRYDEVRLHPEAKTENRNRRTNVLSKPQSKNQNRRTKRTRSKGKLPTSNSTQDQTKIQTIRRETDVPRSLKSKIFCSNLQQKKQSRYDAQQGNVVQSEKKIQNRRTNVVQTAKQEPKPQNKTQAVQKQIAKGKQHAGPNEESNDTTRRRCAPKPKSKSSAQIDSRKTKVDTMCRSTKFIIRNFHIPFQRSHH